MDGKVIYVFLLLTFEAILSLCEGKECVSLLSS